MLLAALVPVLAGCVGAAAVGVGAGSLMFFDRRQAEVQLTDEGIEIRAGNRISEKLGDRAHVNVTSYNRSVLLTGEVPDEAAKSEAEKIVAGVPNVKAITNELKLSTASTLTNRSNDAFITSKVKARFIDAGQFSPVHVKVVTEAGIVHLLGLVTQREATAAVEVARTTAGVRKVVRVMEIISEAEAKRLDPAPPAPPAQKAPEQPAS
jgi:osmotically-inducible protein OsmY